MDAPGITTYNESPLHAALKAWYAQPGDEIEKIVDRAVIDIVRGPLLIEIQTGSFGKIRSKLQRLLADHPVRLVYPIAQEKWIARMEGEKLVGKRRSPVRGTWWHAFRELVYIPHLVPHPRFSLELVLTHEVEERTYVGRKAWRKRGWGTDQRKLLAVVDHRRFADADDFLCLFPPSLEEPFTTADLAIAIGEPQWLAQKVAYGLHHMGGLEVDGKRGRSRLYRSALPNS